MGMGTGGTALPAGNAPAPAAPEATYADRIWGRDAMTPARDIMRREHGGMSFSQLMINLAELQVRQGRDGYHWDAEFWYGGDINRLTLKTEGEGTLRGSAGGEVQALYSRAIGPYFNLQAGVRQDVAPGPDRTYATVGFEGLAPYWFDVEGALFLSDKGDVFGRLEGYYDQRIIQRLVLQPRVELNLSAQDFRASGVGSGLTDAEAGLRLRYEIRREFAPYVGVSWERKFGDTARFARAAGSGTGGFSVVAGIRSWF
ncbi:copper resistance protein B [Sphingomonas floccifaciens]|uniref:Copper resistance protein B n=1 Tax=Sphingomonas floccifaciens TaxID=1844115 RepID=A0ABW4NFJ3_9SPHN